MKNIRSRLDSLQSADFVSITFDPARDTPSKLARYRSKFRIEGEWQFLTGAPTTIDSVMNTMGIRRKKRPVSDSATGDTLGYTFNHTNQINLLDTKNRVRAEYGGSMVPPKYVVKDIRKLTD